MLIINKVYYGFLSTMVTCKWCQNLLGVKHLRNGQFFLNSYACFTLMLFGLANALRTHLAGLNKLLVLEDFVLKARD